MLVDKIDMVEVVESESYCPWLVDRFFTFLIFVVRLLVSVYVDFNQLSLKALVAVAI